MDEDPDELVNLAADPNHLERLLSLRKGAIDELKRTDCPFAETMPPTASPLKRKNESQEN